MSAEIKVFISHKTAENIPRRVTLGLTSINPEELPPPSGKSFELLIADILVVSIIAQVGMVRQR